MYYQINNRTHQGLTNFIFLLYNQSELIIEFLTNEISGILKGCEVIWAVEPEPMGTGGAIAYSVKHLNIEGDFLVTNADTHGRVQEEMKSLPFMHLQWLLLSWRIRDDVVALNCQTIKSYRSKKSLTESMLIG